MRTVFGVVLTATLYLSSYAGTGTLPSGAWVIFTPSAISFDSSLTIHQGPPSYLSPPSCSSITDSTDFYWAYYDACTCTTPCCPSIMIESVRPFYMSRKDMNYSDYKGDTAKLADTTLFVKCTTSVGCQSASLLFDNSLSMFEFLIGTVPNYNLVISGGVDSLSTRLFVFETRNFVYVPLRIDKVILGEIIYNITGQLYPKFDSICITFGNSLIATEVHTKSTSFSRNAVHVSKAGEGYVISGIGADNSNLEIVNGQGKTVYCRPVISSTCMISKNVLRPGIYFILVHSRAGISSEMLTVQ